MTGRIPDKAMVLAAGLGKRMRPITERIPKPLVPIAGKPLIDWGLDALANAGVGEAVVNVHYLAPLLIAHLQGRASPRVRISDESEELLDSAGGIVGALPWLGTLPFFVLNADTFWVGGDENLAELGLAWDDARMDILLMLADLDHSTGHSGRADFLLAQDGRLSRAGGAPDGLIYAGAAIVNPGIFAGAAAEPHSLNLYFDRAIAEGRLYGHPMRGHWITVGTPDAIATAEAAVARHSANL
ncbi:MAG: nucleotidyltransferase family protein [Rhizobiaceae bacterium]|nr:nucleotidyltransferase family protein [Rhizobiaceae bacterium]